ncbi:UNVERIFIED_CONTAM: hypothetical protein Slati_4510200 [Sesamum latifolium]|uniref:Uncharacterized protein n=1 Tax=Sesamum latifolium TaxID=2727402 RepID=A0AAW2SSJ6_9LAMI
MLPDKLNQDGAADDDTRSCPLDADPNSYYYDGGPYDYVSGLADRFHDVLHAAEQPLWNGCTTSQLAVVAELKLMKDLDLPGEKIDACKNGCMLYWKDDINLDYCKFCGEARYKSIRERNPNRMKTPYAMLRQRRDPYATHLIRRRGDILTGHIPILQRSHVIARDETFAMRAALMWIVNDLPAYGMASGWSSVGVMECPVCMEDTRAFYLQNGTKAWYFDCHRQFLPPDHPCHRNKKAFTKKRVERNSLKSLVMRLKCRCHSKTDTGSSKVDKEKHLLGARVLVDPSDTTQY